MIRAATVMLLVATPCCAEPSAFLNGVGGNFVLTDQNGNFRTQADPEGQAQLLFFGYANCQQVCSSVLPQMAEVADELALMDHIVHPLMITVDPLADSVEKIGQALEQFHPDFVGLTGSDEELQIAYDAFQIEKELLFDDPTYGPVYAHGSFLYLLDGNGAVLTLIPPVLSDAEIVKIISNYLQVG